MKIIFHPKKFLLVLTVLVVNVDMSLYGQCNSPSNGIIENVTETMADISWTLGGDCVTEARYWVTTATASDVNVNTGTLISCAPTFPITADGLTKATMYYLYGYEDCGSSNTGIVYLGDFTTDDYCPNITSGTVTNISNFSASLSWDTGPLCDVGVEYWVKTSSAVPIAGTGTLVDCDVTFPIDLTGLADSTQHFVYVLKDCGMGNVSGPNLIADFTTEDFCSIMSGATFENITSASVDISWDNGSSCTTNIEYWLEEDMITPSIGTGNEVSCDVSFPITVSGLEPATEYHLYVYKDCEIETVGPLYLGAFTSETDCAVPTALVLDNIREDMADLTWTLSGGCVDEARYWVNTSSSVPESITSDNPNVISCNPSFPIQQGGLEAGTKYFVFGYEDCGGNNVSNIELLGDFTTLEFCPEPNDFAVDNITTSSASLSWSMGDFCTSESTYWIKDTNDLPTVGVGGVSFECDNTMPIEISDLEEGTLYYVFVHKVCVDGNTFGPVELGSFTTDCPEPDGLVVENITGLMAELTWTMSGGDCSSTPEYWVESTSSVFISDANSLDCDPTFPLVETGLEPETMYYVHSREYCGVSNSGVVLLGTFVTTDDTLFTFTTSNSSLWSDPGNWNQAMLPGETDTVIIENATPILDVDVVISALTLINSTIVVNPGIILSILEDE